MDGFKLFGAAVAGYALATVAAVALTRRDADGGGLNVTRRCGRRYVTVFAVPLTRPWNPAAYDRAKEPDADKGEG